MIKKKLIYKMNIRLIDGKVYGKIDRNIDGSIDIDW